MSSITQTTKDMLDHCQHLYDQGMGAGSMMFELIKLYEVNRDYALDVTTYFHKHVVRVKK
jgi:hypothetical protein